MRKKESPSDKIDDYRDLIYKSDLAEVDPDTDLIVSFEESRQEEKLILIPSESICPRAIRQVLGSPFTNIYAEGYPPLTMTRQEEKLILDFAYQLSYYRRYSDRRFYKGTEYADLIEVLAQRRAAECFATEEVNSDQIFVNIQPLSGAAANNAVYEAFLQPGDTVMGMDLFQGGHLTHGSQFNRSGKRYHTVSYGVNEETGRLDYEEIARLAIVHRPKMIIAGYTSYPWAPDWQKFREIADEVGALLLADIAHPAGMVIAGVYPSPVGKADVITFTTHKTVCGPRGAVILTTDENKAKKIDNAVFPGEQGGPHVNKFAAMAVAFRIARTDKFRKLQQRIVENAKALAEALKRSGLKVAYGGTDTHLMLIDLNAIRKGIDLPLRGEPAARILDLCGLVTNKNTIPGDSSTALASGIRLGTPWITQRGMGKAEMKEIAQLIQRVLVNIHPFSYSGSRGELPRGKIALEIMEEVKERVARLTGREKLGLPETNLLEIRGERAKPFLQGAATGNIVGLREGQTADSLILDSKGNLIDAVSIRRLKPDDTLDRYLMATHPAMCGKVKIWLEGLSDGYLFFDEEDILRKIEGPVVIEEGKKADLTPPEVKLAGRSKLDGLSLYNNGYESLFSLSKGYFVGQKAVGAIHELPLHGTKLSLPKKEFQYEEKKVELRRTPLYEEHLKLGAKMVEFAGWEMPLRYSSMGEEHRAVREKAALFDVGHMGILEVSGEDASIFLDMVSTNYVKWLQDGQCCYSFLLDPNGNVIDDIFIYRIRVDQYMLVVNAINVGKNLSWLEAVNSREFLIDRASPEKELEGKVTIRNLKDLSAGKDRRIDLSLQGPNSLAILGRLTRDGKLAGLRKMEFMETELDGTRTIISRTGYTGKERGYELYLHPDDASRMWGLLLKEGKEEEIRPAGLGARDSTRIEAGLPLYGHELAGEQNISPLEAGFPACVKFHKPYFIGREISLKKDESRKMEIVRFRMEKKGMRAVRKGDPVVDGKEQEIGLVTSSTLVGGIQRGMVYIQRGYAREGTKIVIVSLPRKGEMLQQRVKGEAVALPRFPRRSG